MAPEADPFESTRMSLAQHLDELRRRLVRGLGTVLVCFVFAWAFYEEIADYAIQPYLDAVEKINAHWVEHYTAECEGDADLDPKDYFVDPEAEPRVLVDRLRVDTRLSLLKPAEGFLFALKLCFYFALFAGGPVLLWQLWQFVAAGLYPEERRAALRYFPYSVALFVIGALFGYFVMIPNAMYYLGIAFSPDFLAADFRLEYYFSMLTTLTLALALVFQLPVVMTFVARLGLVEVKTLSNGRGYFVVGSFVIAAILTPPDPVTQSLMAVPMIGLYEVGLIAARLVAKPRAVPEDPQDPPGEAGP